MKTRVICLIPEAKVRNEAVKQKVCGICGQQVPTPSCLAHPLKPMCPVSHFEWWVASRVPSALSTSNS